MEYARYIENCYFYLLTHPHLRGNMYHTEMGKRKNVAKAIKLAKEYTNCTLDKSLTEFLDDKFKCSIK